MAAGFGVAAVRALARRVPIFRSSFSSTSAEQAGQKRESTIESACGVSFGGREVTLSTMAATLDEQRPDGVVDEEHSAQSDEEDGDVCDPSDMVMAIRSRTFSCSEIPSPSQFLSRQQLATYEQLYSIESSASVKSRSVSEDGRDASEAEIEESEAEEELSEVADEESEAEVEESDAEEMYSGPLQPMRTSVRRDFPAPSEYFTREELSTIMEEFNRRQP
eukprot:TRINITY_DN5092_c1_g1_i1.p1 TRINITY_DN5092_c1_g1~~TRINITY_DN5092_c1_g1_i1.p1  ORF type:complete len:220 (-),score=42.22 TRINITY_DN5092_c1_g1_i1:59-718(-)